MRVISKKLNKRCNIIFFFLVIAYLTHARWFFLFPMPLHPRLVFSLCSLLSCLCITNLYKDVPGIKKSLLPLFLLLAVEMMLSLVNYPTQSFIETTKQMFEYYVVLMALSMYVFTRCVGSSNKIEHAIIIIGLIMSTVICVQLLTGIHITNLYAPSERIGVRYPHNAEPILFGTIFALLHFMESDESSGWKKICLATIMIGIYEIVVIAQTRGVIFMMSGGIISFFYYRSLLKSRKTIGRTLFFIVVFFLVFFIISNTSIFKEYTEYSELTSDTSENTMGIRTLEMLHVAAVLLENPLSFLFGAGFISEYNMMFGFTDFISNETLTFKELTSDIGLVGYLGVFGLFGLFWILGLVIYVSRIIVRCYNRKIDASPLVAVFAIFIVGFYSLFLYNNERLPYFSFVLFYAFYYDYKVREFDRKYLLNN